MPNVRVKRATAILRKRMPTSGSFRSTPSRMKRPFGVPCQTFTPITKPTMTTKIINPNMLPTKLLNAITMRVGSGRSTPNPTNNVAKIGTTFHSKRVMTPAATPRTATG